MRVLVVEDIITTGGSVRKSVEHLRARGADVEGRLARARREDVGLQAEPRARERQHARQLSAAEHADGRSRR